MKLHFKVDLYNFDDPQLTGNSTAQFENLSDHTDWDFMETDKISFYINGSTREVVTENTNPPITETFTSQFSDLSINGRYIEFDGELYSDYELLKYFIDNNIIQVIPNTNETLVYLYTQNSENNALEKDITLVNIITGKFNHSIGVKSLNVDVVNIDMNFNYVYIPSLNRYYYVDSVEIVSNDVRRLMLKEDVLMSWQSLIKQQSAFVDRQENLYDADIVDDLVTYSYDKSIINNVIELYTDIYENTENNKLNFVIETVGG